MLGYEIHKFLVLSVVSTNLVFLFFSTLLSLVYVLGGRFF